MCQYCWEKWFAGDLFSSVLSCSLAIFGSSEMGSRKYMMRATHGWALVSGGLAGVRGPEDLWSGTFIASSSPRPLAPGLWWGAVRKQISHVSKEQCHRYEWMRTGKIGNSGQNYFQCQISDFGYAWTLETHTTSLESWAWCDVYNGGNSHTYFYLYVVFL